jgi:outer membrane protein assembly factor BamD (BamD/ComL family)
MAVALLPALAMAADPQAQQPMQTWELRDGRWQAVAAAPTTQISAEPVLDQVDELLAKHRYDEAHTLVGRWLKSHPKDAASRDRALLALAECSYQDADREEAFYYCDELMDTYPDSPLFYRALELQYRIADAYLNGYRKKFLGIPMFGAEEEAVEMLFRIQQRSPGSPLAERALLRTADYYYADSQFDLAADAYGAYARAYPRSPAMPRVRLRQAFSALAQFRGLRFDATPLLDARAQLLEIAAAYPQLASEENVQSVVERIDSTFARKLYNTADYYRRTHDARAAVYNYRYLIQTYPTAPEADRARRDLQRMPAWALNAPPPATGNGFAPTTMPSARAY